MSRSPTEKPEELAALVAVMSEGSFTAAGRLIGRHSTVISKRIASLEARLGVRLVERTTRRVSLTEAGRNLAEKVQVAHRLIEVAEEEAASGASEPRGTIRLSLPAAMGRRWLAPLLPEFLRRYPAIQLDLRFSEHFVDLVGDRIDVAIRIGTLPDSGLVARRLVGHKRILAASPDYISRAGKLEKPEDVGSHDSLLFTGFSSFPLWHLTNGTRNVTVRPEGRFISDESEALSHAALAGLGILGAGEWLVAREIAEGRLIRVLPDWAFDVDGGIYLVRPSKQHTPAHISLFCNWMADQFAHGPPWQHNHLTPSE